MTVTYKPVPGFPEIKTPVLHRVNYTDDTDLTDWYLYTDKDLLINEWLKENCQGNYYHSPDYLPEKFIQFEDDHDALLFALRWS
jgi:hypothetical protein